MDLLVQGGTYFEIKNGDDPFLQFLTGNKFALKHASMMRMCNKIKTKLVHFHNTSSAWCYSKTCSQINRRLSLSLLYVRGV